MINSLGFVDQEKIKDIIYLYSHLKCNNFKKVKTFLANWLFKNRNKTEGEANHGHQLSLPIHKLED